MDTILAGVEILDRVNDELSDKLDSIIYADVEEARESIWLKKERDKALEAVALAEQRELKALRERDGTTAEIVRLKDEIALLTLARDEIEGHYREKAAEVNRETDRRVKAENVAYNREAAVNEARSAARDLAQAIRRFRSSAFYTQCVGTLSDLERQYGWICDTSQEEVG